MTLLISIMLKAMMMVFIETASMKIDIFKIVIDTIDNSIKIASIKMTMIEVATINKIIVNIKSMNVPYIIDHIIIVINDIINIININARFVS